MALAPKRAYIDVLNKAPPSSSANDDGAAAVNRYAPASNGRLEN
jgi:hypothetical protein